MTAVEDRLAEIEARYDVATEGPWDEVIAALRAVLQEHRPMPPLSNPDPTLNCYTCDEPSPCDTIRVIAAVLDVTP